MSSKLLRTAFITATLAVAPSLAAGQDAAATSAAPAAASAPAAPSEAQQIQQRLGQVQQQAMQDAALQAAFAEINTALEAADPEFKTLSDRARTLKADVATAQAASDNARLHQLAAEAKQLQTNLPAARARATQNPAVQEKVVAFRTALAEKMQQIDPEIPALLTRLGELQK